VRIKLTGQQIQVNQNRAGDQPDQASASMIAANTEVKIPTLQKARR
jgi:hypothetical protein